MNVRHTFTTTPPAWTICDRETDATDVWRDETDPKNEREEACTAYLRSDGGTGFEVRGFCVEDQYGKRYVPVAWFTARWGTATVWRIEASEMQAASEEPPHDGSDDAYDTYRAELSLQGV